MRRIATASLAGCALLLAAPAPSLAASKSCSGADSRLNSRNATKIRSATLCLLNRERAKRGLPKLRAAGTLRGAAQRYARRMVRKRFFAHVSPTGSTMTGRVKRTKYLRGARSWSLGENLAWGAGSRGTPRAIVRSWMRSPGHRRNILNRRFRHVGIGVTRGAPARGVRGATTYVNNFGSRSR